MYKLEIFRQKPTGTTIIMQRLFEMYIKCPVSQHTTIITTCNQSGKRYYSDCSSTKQSNEQLFSYIMLGTSYIRWDDDDIGFVVDQHSLLNFNSVSW